MSSEHLASAQNQLKGNLGGAWDMLSGAQGNYTDLGTARRFGGAAGAYSLRDIGAMNGRVVNVRRSGDDANADFSANQVISGSLAAWVDAGGGDKDGFVEVLYDQSGNGKDISQTSSDADQPQIVDNGAVLLDNGKPTMKFTANAEFLDTASTVTVSSGAQFIVCNATDVSSGRALIGKKSANTDFFRFTSSDSESYKANSQGTTFGTIAEGEQLIVSVDRDGSNNTEMFEDNAQSGTTKTNITGNFVFERMGARNAAADPYVGTISELIMFDGDYSSDRETITREINNYYKAF